MSKKNKTEERKRLYQLGIDYRNLGLTWDEVMEDHFTNWELEIVWSGYQDQDKIIREAWDNNEGF